MCFWFLTHTCSLQSLSTVTGSALRLWGEFWYPQIWSLLWCHDDVMMVENRALYQEHFPEKSYNCLLPEFTLWYMSAGYLYIHLQECMFPTGYLKLGCELLALYSWLGCEHDLKREKDKDLEPSRRESSRRVSWLSSGYSSTVIPDILGSFPIQVTNLSLPIYWGDCSWKGLRSSVSSKLARVWLEN